MSNFDKLKLCFGDLKSINTKLTEKGFGISALEKNEIESVRKRTLIEKEYLFYLQEKLLESFSFYDAKWRRDERNKIDMHYRSNYIDLLCSSFNDINSIYGLDNHDREDIYLKNFNKDADPNYLLFARLSHTDFERMKLFGESCLIQLELEKEKFANKIDEIFNVGQKGLTKNLVIKMFHSAAEYYGMNVIRNNNDKDAVLEIKTANHFLASLDWYDSLVLSKWGLLMIAMKIDIESAGNITPQKVTFRLDSFIPGANWYTKTNRDLYRIALGILFHMEFLNLLNHGS